MRRALRLAGARTVVMSLWEVDDEATAALMAAVYAQRFGRGRDVPTAMAAARRETLAARRAADQSDAPYYWAAFVAEGGWRWGLPGQVRKRWLQPPPAASPWIT